jgi:hypothetical protein
MVRAILDGSKTVTRRLVKHEHLDLADRFAFDSMHNEWEFGETHQGPVASVGWMKCPYGAPGDLLWVRETWAPFEPEDGLQGIAYAASCDGRSFNYVTSEGGIEQLTIKRWKPSIFMRPAYSRITLEVTDVRIERLHAITEEDAKAEGVERFRVYEDGDDDEANGHGYAPPLCSHLGAFELLWEQINGKRAPWSTNPWVWRVEFRRAR